MRWLLLLPVLSLGTACTPVIVERGGPPPAYPAEPPVVYQPMPAPDYPPRDEARRPGRDRDEYQERRVDVIIERAYRDLLERVPDPEGREHYRQLIHQGCTEEQMRDRIRESVEYRVALPDAKTTRAYRKVLGREPDPSGLESYRRKIVDKGWTEKDVENDLRRSAEYRNRRK
jgi:hypothetical protein